MVLRWDISESAPTNRLKSSGRSARSASLHSGRHDARREGWSKPRKPRARECTRRLYLGSGTTPGGELSRFRSIRPRRDWRYSWRDTHWRHWAGRSKQPALFKRRERGSRRDHPNRAASLHSRSSTKRLCHYLRANLHECRQPWKRPCAL
jgi:hypothetical protein